MTVIIREATPADLEQFYGRMPPVTVRAIVALRDGVIECVAGITLEKNVSVAFSDMRTAADKKTILKTARQMVEWMRKYRPMVLLTPEQMCSDKFLKRLGFTHLGEKHEMNVYRLNS